MYVRMYLYFRVLTGPKAAEERKKTEWEEPIGGGGGEIDEVHLLHRDRRFAWVAGRAFPILLSVFTTTITPLSHPC